VQGLEAIKEKIRAQANSQAEDILASANEQRDVVLDKANEEARDFLKEAARTDLAERKTVLKREESLAVSEGRKIILAAKQDLISKSIDSALKSILEDKGHTKEDMYLKVLEKYVKGGERVKVSAVDRPLLESIKAKSGLDFNLDPESGNFDGGLIIYKDQVEVNLSFDMVVYKSKSDLTALAAGVLFA